MIVAVVLHYRREAMTAACIRALQASATPVRVLLVDNASGDGSFERLQAQFPAVDALQTGANLGYAGGNNRGIAWALRAGAQFVLVINDDAEVAPECVGYLVAALEADAGAAVAAPTLVHEGPERRIWWAGGRWDPWRISGHHVGYGEPLARSRTAGREAGALGELGPGEMLTVIGQPVVPSASGQSAHEGPPAVPKPRTCDAGDDLPLPGESGGVAQSGVSQRSVPGSASEGRDVPQAASKPRPHSAAQHASQSAAQLAPPAPLTAAPLSHAPRLTAPPASRPTSCVTGCLVLFRAEALRQAGAFREDFGSYVEDLELSLRYRRLGWRLLHVPPALGIHKVAYPEGAPAPWKIVRRDQNRRRVAQLHLTRAQRWRFYALFAVTRTLLAGGYLLRGDVARAEAIVEGALAPLAPAAGDAAGLAMGAEGLEPPTSAV